MVKYYCEVKIDILIVGVLYNFGIVYKDIGLFVKVMGVLR